MKINKLYITLDVCLIKTSVKQLHLKCNLSKMPKLCFELRLCNHNYKVTLLGVGSSSL